DEYHVPVPVVDVWAEYHRLANEEGWEQKRIAEAKGADKDTVSLRVRLHSADHLHKYVRDGCLDESHWKAVMEVVSGVPNLESWRTTEQVQSELVKELHEKHRGKTSDDPKAKKPSVKAVRDVAARWKALIAAAQDAHHALACEKDGDRWQKMFVRLL